MKKLYRIISNNVIIFALLFIYIMLLFLTADESSLILTNLYKNVSILKNIFIFDFIIFLYLWNKIRDNDIVFGIIRRKDRFNIVFRTIIKLVAFTFIYLDTLYIILYNVDRILYHEINDYLSLLNYKVLLYIICGLIFEIIKKQIRYIIVLVVFVGLYYVNIPLFFLFDIVIICLILYVYRILECDLID